jgi:hypothetical protein
VSGRFTAGVLFEVEIALGGTIKRPERFDRDEHKTSADSCENDMMVLYNRYNSLVMLTYRRPIVSALAALAAKRLSSRLRFGNLLLLNTLSGSI